MSEIVIAAADGGSFSAYVATPAGGSGPGVVVIQEIFGVNAGMRAICDDLAAQGYVAVCPDLFWRQEPGIQITDKTDAEWKRAFELFQGFDVDLGVADLQATLAATRALSATAGRKVGCVGYCLGGKLAYLMATRSDVDASIAYYGVGLEALLDEAKNIKAPLLAHLAEKDKFVPPEAQYTIKAALATHPLTTLHSYPADHAFARPDGVHRDEVQAALANQRSAEFFATHLKG